MHDRKIIAAPCCSESQPPYASKSVDTDACHATSFIEDFTRTKQGCNKITPGSGLLALSYVVQFRFQSKGIETGKREAEEETDAPVKRGKCATECSLDFFRCSPNGGGIRNTPMRGHRLARPEGTYQIGRASCR